MRFPLGRGVQACSSGALPRRDPGTGRGEETALHPHRHSCQPRALASRCDLASVEQGIPCQAVVKMLRGLKLPVTALVWVYQLDATISCLNATEGNLCLGCRAEVKNEVLRLRLCFRIDHRGVGISVQSL